jgi:hypothetical protein
MNFDEDGGTGKGGEGMKIAGSGQSAASRMGLAHFTPHRADIDMAHHD